MRILHVIPTLGPGYGGPTVAVLAMTRALADRGHDVTLATTDAADDNGGRLDVPLVKPVVDRGVAIRYFSRWPAGRWKFSWPLTTWLRKEIASFDVVHVHALFQYPTIPACRISVRRGVPYVLRPLGTLGTWSLQQRAWKKRPYLALVDGPHIRNAAALHATSEWEAKFLRATGARRVEVVPLGVDVPTRLPRSSDARERGSPLRVLFLSRLHMAKGIPVLLDAVRIARASGTPLELRIAGTGERQYEQSLRDMATSFGIDDIVTWLGHVDGPVKAELFAWADAFVLPSSHENFGIAVAEALAAGVPVIVSKEVAIAEEVEAAGAGRALPIDSTQFARALGVYASDPDARMAAGRAGAAFAVATYSWPACAERLEALYRKLASGASLHLRRDRVTETVGSDHG